MSKGFFKRDPPAGVKILAGLQLLIAALLVLVGIGVGLAGLISLDALGVLGAFGAAACLIVAGIITVIALGLWNGERWAWWLFVFTYVLNGLSALAGSQWVLFGVSILLLVYIYSVRAYFKVKF